MFEDLGLDASSSADALSLKGRLLKDRGLRSTGSERAGLLKRAQEAYLQAAGSRPATYPLINAGTIAFLNDRPDEARRIARRVLDILACGDHEPETRYWLGATEAEALLLLDDPQASRHALERAMQSAPEAWEDHAVTLGQFRQILERLGRSPDFFDHLQPPPALYFYGIIGLPDDEAEARGKLDQALDEIRPGAVFGALAAGSDILMAEMAVARGARLHVVLPTSLSRFRQVSVEQYDSGWGQRFDRLMEQAEVIEVLDGNAGLSEAAILNGSQVAMGLALRHARSLATRAVALHLARSTDLPSPAEVEWRAHDLPVRRVILDQWLPARGSALDRATNVTIIAAPGRLPPVLGSAPDTQTEGEFGTVLAFPDLRAAIEHAQALLRKEPALRLGIDSRAVVPGESLEVSGELACLLASAATAGSICASWPQIAALDLLAPDYRFDAAGEIVTAMGNVPIGLFCRLPGPASR